MSQENVIECLIEEGKWANAMTNNCDKWYYQNSMEPHNKLKNPSLKVSKVIFSLLIFDSTQSSENVIIEFNVFQAIFINWKEQNHILFPLYYLLKGESQVKVKE